MMGAMPAEDWSKAETHCPLCLKPFPTADDVERHSEKECDEPTCWCEELCWVNKGGSCSWELQGGDTIELISDLRAALERLEGPGVPDPGRYTVRDGRLTEPCSCAENPHPGYVNDESWFGRGLQLRMIGDGLIKCGLCDGDAWIHVDCARCGGNGCEPAPVTALEEPPERPPEPSRDEFPTRARGRAY